MRKKLTILFVTVLVMSVIIGGAVVGGIMWHVQAEVTQTAVDQTSIGFESEHALAQQGITNIALFITETTAEKAQVKADGLVILTFDSQRQTVTYNQLQTDIMVPMDGYGMEKLSHAYAYGGVQLAVQTLNNAFDLNIGQYLVIDVQGIAAVIDQLGGMTLTIDELEALSLAPAGITTPGEQSVTGAQAIAYALLPNSATTTENHQFEVMQQLRSLLQQQTFKGNFILLNELLPTVETNIPFSQAFDFVGMYLQSQTQLRALPETTPVERILDPATGLWMNYADLELLKQELQPQN